MVNLTNSCWESDDVRLNDATTIYNYSMVSGARLIRTPRKSSKTHVEPSFPGWFIWPLLLDQANSFLFDLHFSFNVLSSLPLLEPFLLHMLNTPVLLTIRDLACFFSLAFPHFPLYHASPLASFSLISVPLFHPLRILPCLASVTYSLSIFYRFDSLLSLSFLSVPIHHHSCFIHHYLIIVPSICSLVYLFPSTSLLSSEFCSFPYHVIIFFLFSFMGRELPYTRVTLTPWL